jgi:hypothetical protein
MAIIPWLEKNVHGDGNIAKDIRAYGERGYRDANAGQIIADEGLGGIRRLDADYTNRLNSGRVLPNSIYKAYSTLRGRVKDTGVAQNTALNADLAQRNAESGGRMSPEALAEMRMQGQEAINQSEFAANVDIGVQESRDELAETNKLMDRIEAARGAILNAGQFRQQLGQQAQIAAMLARLDRHKAIAGTIMQGVSMGMR